MIRKKLAAGILALAFIFSITLAGCHSGNFSNGKIKLHNNIDSVSYAIGFNIGKNMSQHGMNDLDPKVIAQAMDKAFAGDTSKIPPAELRAMMTRYQMQARQKTMKKQQKEAKANKKKGQAFLAKNKSKPGVRTTKDSLQYKVLKKGSGASPSDTSTVVVDYTGKHLNGKVFDQNDSISISLKHVFPGWQEGLQLMKEGATYKFWIPGRLAYGPNPRGNKIKPDETLQFKVHLIKVKK